MKNISIIIFLIVIGLYHSLPTNGQTQHSNSTLVSRGPYLQMVSHNSITIRWRTDGDAIGKVNYGKTLNYGHSVISRDFTFEHCITLSGLDPSTKYYYSVGTEDFIISGDSTYNFLTAPSPGNIDPVRVWVTGDFGTGSTLQGYVRDAFKNYSQQSTNIWLWLGDNAYNNGTDLEYQDYVFNVYPEQLRSIPLYPSIGNHDYGQSGYLSSLSLTTQFPYFDIFTVPQNGEVGGKPSGTPKYYSYNYSNIHFISLDSYGSFNYPGSPMYNWLEDDLATNTQRWTIVYFHHPPFTNGTYDSDFELELVNMRTHIVPLLESYNVDLVLSGHSHSNERSYLMKGHHGTANSFDASMKVSNDTTDITKNAPYDGTIYAVCGTGGQVPGPAQAVAPMPCMYFNDFTTNCSMVIDIDGETLRAKYLSLNGDILDETILHKHGPLPDPLNETTTCSFTFNQQNNTLSFYIFSAHSAKFSANIYNLQGIEFHELNSIPEFIAPGYQVINVLLKNPSLANGIYMVKTRIGTEHFFKKLFFNSNK